MKTEELKTKNTSAESAEKEVDVDMVKNYTELLQRYTAMAQDYETLVGVVNKLLADVGRRLAGEYYQEVRRQVIQELEDAKKTENTK